MSEPQTASAGVYLGVFAALMVLTGITVAVAAVDLGLLNNLIMITIAVTKATLVALYFMHLRYSHRLNGLVMAAAVLWLFILFSITFSDYLTR
jgi:cytochrome c oxidase subunit 4